MSGTSKYKYVKNIGIMIPDKHYDTKMVLSVILKVSRQKTQKTPGTTIIYLKKVIGICFAKVFFVAFFTTLVINNLCQTYT